MAKSERIARQSAHPSGLLDPAAVAELPASVCTLRSADEVVTAREAAEFRAVTARIEDGYAFVLASR